MKSTFSSMSAVALTMCLGLAAVSANAAVQTMSGWEGSAATGYSATFQHNNVNMTFTDSYNFSLPVGSSGNGAANTISLGSQGQVIFDAFTLYETSAGLLGSGATGGTSSSLSFSNGAVPGAYTLNVNGHKTSDSAGSYAGNVVVSPVPEPKTYAMMLLGLGLMGFSARRRMNNL